MKTQRGQIFRVCIRKGKTRTWGKTWYGRWRRDELIIKADGSKEIKRRQHCEVLCEYDRVNTVAKAMYSHCSTPSYNRSTKAVARPKAR
jgi:hypothetical protein